MAVSPSYPGVYVQEVPSGVRTIVGVSTSTTLFIGRTKSGPINTPQRISTYTDFTRAYTEDNNISDVARYLKLFFLNGGTDAYVMRIAHGAVSSTVTLLSEAAAPVLVLTAKNAGKAGDTTRVAVTYSTEQPELTFNVEIFRWEIDTAGNKQKIAREEWRNLSMDPSLPTYAPTFLTQKSSLVNADESGAAPLPINGTSLSGRPIEDDNTEGNFVTVWNALLGNSAAPATPRHSFQISVNGSPLTEVTLHLDGDNTKPPNVSLMPAGSVTSRRDGLVALIAKQIVEAFAAKGISVLPADFSVKIVDGPLGAGALVTRQILISSNKNQDIRIASSGKPGDDLAGAIMWGTANGGLEIGAHSGRRPAPTGNTLPPTQSVLFNGAGNFGSLAQGAITTVTLTELDPISGASVPVAIPVDLVTAGARMWNDSTSGARGIVEKLGLIRDAINTYQATFPSKFFWKAELWGYRLAILPQLPDENDIILAANLATGPTNIGASFKRNVRYYSLGASGSGGFQSAGNGGDDGTSPEAPDYDAAYAIVDSQVDLFNLLVLPPEHGSNAVALTELWPNASAFCQRRRAFLLMDPPDDWDSPQKASTGVDKLRIGLVKDFSAVYFPRLQISESGLTRTVGAAGAMAGTYARIDTARGVWKAPAGTEADIRGVNGVDLRMSDLENGMMNPAGVNAVRLFPDGVVSWGARTMAGADAFASEYKYVPIRRLALYIEESLYRGLKWVVFEPNDEGLWAQIRLNAGAFMQDLFRKGAFQGTKPSDAYFVKCDSETTTQNDRNLGIVNIWIGFAPLKPAEFVILYLQQMAGQLAA